MPSLGKADSIRYQAHKESSEMKVVLKFISVHTNKVRLLVT